MPKLKTLLSTQAAVISALMTAPAAYAQTMYSFDLPAQSLSESLQAVGQTTGTNVAYTPETVRGKRAPALRGSFTTAEAIERLLRGSGLIVSTTAGGSYLVVAQSIAPTAGPGDESEQLARTQASDGMILVVTAQRREQNLQEVPATIAAVSSEDLTEKGVTSSEDLEALVPGLQFGQNPTGNQSVTIRGIGANEAADVSITPNSVAINFDEIYLGAPPLNSFMLFDLERVEVLKGPQGVLYGRNATSGVINIITRDPTDYFSGYLNVSYERFDRLVASAAISGPIGGGLSGRIAATTETGGGYLTNVATVTPNTVLRGDRTANDVSRGGIRAILDWEADTIFRAELLLQRDWDRSDLVPGTLVGEVEVSSPDANFCESQYFPDPALCTDNFGNSDDDGNPFTIESEFMPFVDKDSNRAILSLVADFDAVTITSISGFTDYEESSASDRDGTSSQIVRQDRTLDIQQWSTELRLSGEVGDRFQWLLGGVYAEYEAKENQGVQLNAPFDVHFNSRADESSWGVYAQGEFEIIEGLNLIGGIRYSDESKTFFAESVFLPAGSPIPFDQVAGLSGPGVAYRWLPDGGVERSDSWDNVSSSVSLSYRVAPDLLVYGSWNRGFKSGGFNGSFTTRTSPPSTEDRFRTYDPETAEQFEFGLKGVWLDGNLVTNFSAYRIDLKDRVEQILVPDATSPGGASSQFLNAADSRINGVEAQLQWRPLSGLEANISVAYTDAKYEEFIVDPRPGSLDDRSGFRMPQAPKWSANADVGYEFDLGTSGSVRLGTDVSYRSAHFFNSRNIRAVGSDAYILWDGRATWSSEEGGISLSAFVRNITDKTYVAYAVDSLNNADLQYYGRPRTYGISASYNF